MVRGATTNVQKEVPDETECCIAAQFGMLSHLEQQSSSDVCTTNGVSPASPDPCTVDERASLYAGQMLEFLGGGMGGPGGAGGGGLGECGGGRGGGSGGVCGGGGGLGGGMIPNEVTPLRAANPDGFPCFR